LTPSTSSTNGISAQNSGQTTPSRRITRSPRDQRRPGRLAERLSHLEDDHGRERPWRATGDGLNITPLERTGGNQVIARAFLGNVLDSVQRMLLAGPPESSRDAFGVTVTHGRLRLTDEQVKELDRRVGEVVQETEADELPAGPDAPPLLEFFRLRGNDPNG